MPSLGASTNKTELPIIRIIIAIIIVILIGNYIFPTKTNEKILAKKINGKICLVVDDYGFIFNDLVKDFLSLDSNITAAIIPGTPFSKQIGKYTDSLRIESIIHMPMESFEEEETKYKIELNQKLNSDLIEERVLNAFKEIPTALGMNNHQGSKATANLQLMKDLARTLRKMDKYFLDSFTNPESRAYITMRRYGVPTQLRQVFLDHIDDPAIIKENLDSLVLLSHQMDIAVGIAHIKPSTLSVLQKEIPKLIANGYQFIRLSDAVR